MRKDHNVQNGTVHRLSLDSQVLKGNLLGDPTQRIVDVYVPANHDGKGLPLLVDLVGFTAGGPAHTNWRNFQENIPEQTDRLIHEGRMAQYVNSSAMGNWDDFLLKEAVPFVEKQFGCGGTGKRGVFGKSSGGYGAMVHALLHPDFWSAAASHSGDMGFPLMYSHEFVPVLRALAKNGYDIGKWVDDFWAAPKTKDTDVGIIMMLAQAASFDPDPTARYGVRLPVTLDTCEFIAERWDNWLSWDPLTMVETRWPGLKALKGLYIDCGDIDQYNLVYGARRMHRELDRLGVTHMYEEFPDNHSSVDYRMDVSLPFLAKALSD